MMNNEARSESTPPPPTWPGGQHYHFQLTEVLDCARNMERNTRTTAETVGDVAPRVFEALDAIQRSTRDCVTVLKSILASLIVIGAVALFLLAR
jgi:hypothetical protein